MTSKSERAWGVATAAGFATWAIALLITMETPSDQAPESRRWAVLLPVTLGALAFAAFIGQVWARLEQWTSRLEDALEVRFSNKVPDTLWWAPQIESPRATIARIEGQLLHRRLVLAVREFIIGDAAYGRFDGRDVSDRGEPFQVVVRCLREGQNAPNRWLLIVRDPWKVDQEASATTPEMQVVDRPSVLAAVVTYASGTRNRQATVEELHVLDATYVAGCAIFAWHRVAFKHYLATAGAKATAKLGLDGITWEVRLDVPTTQDYADDADEPLGDLLAELRVPVVVEAWSALLHDDSDDADRDETAGGPHVDRHDN